MISSRSGFPMALAASAVLLPWAQDVSGQAPSTGSDETRAQAVHLLERATFGPRPQDIDEVVRLGVDAWLDRQLHPEGIDDAAVESLVAERFPAATMSGSELLELYPPNQIVGALRRIAQDSTTSEADQREAAQILRQNNPGQIVQQLTGARLTRAAHSERQLEEMMTEFWFDHFNVDFRKNQLRWLVADYEGNAIRPNVFGTFYDLLAATAAHPAMLVYLDNAQSVAPDSARMAGPRRRAQLAGPLAERLRDRGINENYARELMELHTLGVDGGYTQDDVIQVARAFTGWGISPPAFDRADLRGLIDSDTPSVAAITSLLANASYDGAFEFTFRPLMHDPGDKVVMGRTIEGSRGMDDALAVLEMLATAPATARHIATQLVTKFVSDDPPPEMVEEIARVFLDTGGDLREVTRALFTSPYLYAPGVVGSKVKSPFVLAASTVRMTDADVVNVRALTQTLEALGEAPYRAEAPTGYPETSGEWVSGGALLNRMDFGQAFAAGEVRGLRMLAPGELIARGGARGATGTPEVPRPRTADAPGVDIEGALAERLFPAGGVEELVASVRATIGEEGVSEPRQRFTRALGLFLGSPAFQSY